MGRIIEISVPGHVTAATGPKLSWRFTMSSVRIRAAGPQDLSALVRLRLLNARHHVDLGPKVHRLPDAGAVRGYFTDRLRGGEDDLMLLAETDDDEVAGMAEIVVRRDPPEHQILIPKRVAEVHTVVLDTHRGRGVGRALLAAAETGATPNESHTLAPWTADDESDPASHLDPTWPG